MTREEAIGKLRGLVSSCPLKHDEWQAIEVAIEALKEQRPHGEWKKDGFFAICSECGHELQHYELVVSRLNFCPNCGALMQASYRQVTGKLKQPCPCDTCQTAIDRCGCQMHLCSDYQKWKEGEAE